MTLLPERLQGCERGMEAKESVEIDYVLAWNVNARPHRVILFLAVRDDDVESVGCAALKDNHQALGASSAFDGAERSARQEARHGRCADYGESAVAKEHATGWHGHLLLASTGLKPQIRGRLNAALEGPLFHGAYAARFSDSS